MDLLIIESPNKIKKLRQILGAGYHIMSTVGHFRDLPQRDLGVDTQTFEATYVVNDGKKDMVRDLERAVQKADRVILATDPDREGEAIAWHVAQVLNLEKPLRAEFHEITKTAVNKALKNIREVDFDLVEAQQARRILDRLVGYILSPELRSLGDRLSAGRVQSCVLHLICRRENERLEFKERRYWTIKANYANGLTAGVADVDDAGKLKLVWYDQDPAEIIAQLKSAEHRVTDVEGTVVERKPKPPFETSSLLKAAGTRLGWTADQTSKVAQRLFEGGAITYIRTDSVSVAPEASEAARTVLRERYPNALPEQPPVYRSKAGSQEAHECIRPTDPAREVVDEFSKDEAELYTLIWRRFLASQASAAIFQKTTLTIQAGDVRLRAIGMVLQDPGFLAIGDIADDEEEGEDGAIPTVTTGEVLAVASIDSEAKKTSPPPRYKEATLIETMKRLGIGRPSTYSSTLGTLFKRGYIDREGKKKNPAVFPTELGFRVDGFLEKGVPEILEPAYTAAMENALDEIAGHKQQRVVYLRGWYADFSKRLTLARGLWHQPMAGTLLCARCNAPMKERNGKFGTFLGCGRFPLCKFTRPLDAAPVS
jgi:DNA topoisomerase I